MRDNSYYRELTLKLVGSVSYKLIIINSNYRFATERYLVHKIDHFKIALLNVLQLN